MIKYNKKSFLSKFVLSSVLVTFMLLTFVNALIFSVVYINFKANEEIHIKQALEDYQYNYKIAENNAYQKSNYLIGNLDVIEILNSIPETTGDKYQKSLTLVSYVKALSDESVRSITIFSENSSLFECEFVRDIKKLQNYDGIKDMLGSSYFHYVSHNLSDTPYLSFYRQIGVNFNTILQIDMFLPSIDLANGNIFLTENISEFDDNKHLYIELNDNCYAVSSINTDLLSQQRLTYLSLFFMAEICLFLISLFVTKKIHKKTTSAVEQLIKYTSLNYDETLSASYLNEQSEYQEIEQIKDAIRSLVASIERISTEKNAVELEKKDLSLKLLQSRLNPHFLYNILSVVSYRALMTNDNEIFEIINELIAYYRMILSKGKDFVTLNEELTLLEKYVFLAKTSHSKHYELTIDVPDEMKCITIPHMFLQPFVENSIIHGLSGNREDCRINITGKMYEDYLEFVIYDNGYGMNQQTLDAMNNLPDNTSSYGIKNTYERMKLIYTKNFSITYESEINTFTKVSIKIPIPDKK